MAPPDGQYAYIRRQTRREVRREVEKQVRASVEMEIWGSRHHRSGIIDICLIAVAILCGFIVLCYGIAYAVEYVIARLTH